MTFHRVCDVSLPLSATHQSAAGWVGTAESGGPERGEGQSERRAPGHGTTDDAVQHLLGRIGRIGMIGI
eukprot:gene20643-biopygen19127